MSSPTQNPVYLKEKRIVITRMREDADSLVEGIRIGGGVPILCPAIRIEYFPLEFLKKKIGPLSKFSWIIFTSRHAVKSIKGLLRNNPFEGKIAAIGRKTSDEIRKLGLEINFLASKSTGESLRSELAGCVKEDQLILLPQSQIASKTVSDGLKDKGIRVTAITTYNTLPGKKEDAAELIEWINRKIPDAILFASPSALRGIRKMLSGDYFEKLMEHAAIFSIGPATTGELESSGFSPAREADPHNSDGLIQALTSYYTKG